VANTMPNNSDQAAMSNPKTARDLIHKFDQLKTDRMSRERQWKLNLSFYRGNQYVFYNRINRRIEQLPVDDADKPRHRVRITANRITRGVQGYVAKQTKTKPVITATPESGDDNALKAAQVAETLLEQWWVDFHMAQKLDESLLWSAITGQGYWKITWDAYANKPITFVLNPQTKEPIVDETLKTIFLAELDKAGVSHDEVTKTVYMGDISVECLSPFDVYLDTSARTFDECKFAICRHAMNVDEIKAKYKVDAAPDAQTGMPDDSFSYYPLEMNKKRNLKYVYYGYFKPCPELPKGRYVVWMDSTSKPDKNTQGATGGQIVIDEPWDFPFQQLPLIKFPGVTVPGEVYASSVVEHAIPLQKEYNRSLSQIIEHKNLTLKPQWISPVGSLREKLTTEPGAVYQYNPVQGLGPQPMPIPGIPSYVFDHLNGMKVRLDEMFNDTEITQGGVPPNVEAGIAIDLLQEMATDRMAPTIRLLEEALAEAGQMMLSIAQKNYIEQRVIKMKGSGSATKVKQFTRADISGGITIRAESGSGLPRTRAGRQSQIIQWVREGILPKDRAWKYFDSADMKAVGQQFMADSDMAEREHEKILEGKPINEVALHDMQEQLQNTGGIDPHTNQPIDPQQMQKMLDDASLSPTDYEDWQEHMDVHKMFMKSVEFEGLDPEMKDKFITHYKLTLQRFMEIPRMPEKIEAPKISLRMNGTIGPTGAAQMLNRAGILDVNPDIMSEPPLETVVFDNIDKPNPGEAGANVGNDPYAKAALDEFKRQQALLQQQQQHEQLLQQQEQLHQQKLAHNVESQKAKTV
jgi:hypothetical protein